MKRKITTILVVLLTVMIGLNLKAQWSLVWSDEFNGSMSSDWIVETGTGDWGWGNNEQQYYRAENLSIVNGALQIQARNEYFAGMNYTSGRIKTQGKKSFKYGKIEARIAMPSFSGVWPAFWMLGDNFGSVNWPACGEIDIMEHVNTGGEIYGTIHWEENGHASYGGSTTTSITSYHVYSIEWDDQYIRWFVDGSQYHEAFIGGGINGTSELHNNFFIILNMAIGGEWPGYNIDNSAMPANMLVDYVRVYQKSSGSTGVSGLGGTYVIQNRNSGMVMDVVNGDPANGTNILQYINNGTANQQFTLSEIETGIYKIANVATGKSVDIEGVSTENFANVHQWDYVGGGNQKFQIESTGDGYYKLRATHSNKIIEVGYASLAENANINQYDDNGQTCGQWKLLPTGSTSWSTTIEAESYSNMSGIDVENCSEGGQNVGWIDAGDWIVWDIDLPNSGSYNVEYRVASLNGGGTIQLEKAGGSPVYGSISVPSTGGWQNWTSISHNVNLEAGVQQIAIYAPNGGYNINWLKLSSGFKSAEDIIIQPELKENISLFPIPAIDDVSISGISEPCNVNFIDLNGKVVLEKTIDDGTNTINVMNLHSGLYIIKISNATGVKLLKFVKQ
jgi:beta-glucanase (GH16 family)